jgi:hypothetical protein
MVSRLVQQPADTSRRICTRCGAEGPIDGEEALFYKAKPGSANDRTYGGVAMPCKRCNAARCKARGWKPADNETRRRTLAQRPERVAADQRRSLAWAASEHGKAWRAADYAANRETIRAERKAAYASSPAVRLRLKAGNRRRRARKRLVVSTLTADEWLDILDYFGHACAYCRRTDRPLTQDHVIPIVDGGGHTAENVVPACLTCNCSKGDRPIWTMLRAA